jgi:hypothetical protein
MRSKDATNRGLLAAIGIGREFAVGEDRSRRFYRRARKGQRST